MPSGVCTQTVIWKEAAPEGTEIRVYGITRCLLAREHAGSGSCVGRHTPVPGSVRKLIARAPASEGSVSWTRPAWLDNVRSTGGQTTYGVDRDGDAVYYAIEVAAYNAAGHSALALVDAGTWCSATGCVGP